jgi:hypothetical protein
MGLASRALPELGCRALFWFPVFLLVSEWLLQIPHRAHSFFLLHNNRFLEELTVGQTGRLREALESLLLVEKRARIVSVMYPHPVPSLCRAFLSPKKKTLIPMPVYGYEPGT